MKDWGSSEQRALRKANKALGPDCEIKITFGSIRPFQAMATDYETNQSYGVGIGPPSKYVQQIQALHELIYRERGRFVFHRQKGLCAICGQPMKGTENTETDHKLSRGAHGRDDRIENLQAVHGNPCHRDKHSKGKA